MVASLPEVWVRGHRKMNQVLGAFGLLYFTMLRPVLAWGAFGLLYVTILRPVLDWGVLKLMNRLFL
jgi:hypothetical protein